LKYRLSFVSRTVLVLSALAALGAPVFDAQALGLGRLNVQSALGEGLRAEIDLISLSAEESASLSVRIASPEAYRQAGVDYSAVLAGTRAVVVQGADGRASLRLSSDRAVQEPFVELILELNWTSGRLVREFTLLFDPPGARGAVQAPVAPVISAAPPAATPKTLPAAPAASAEPVAPAAASAVVAAPPRPAAQAMPAKPNALVPDAAASSTGQRYPVRSGDTLYGVAGRLQSPGVSLDQMLVGLYRANPEAFIERNVNRLRAGVVLAVPTADEVRDLSNADLQRLISAQSIDFGAYRSRLAQGAPQAQAQDPGRQAQGKLRAAVDDRKQSGAASPDKLKLSGGAASSPEAEIARAAESRDNAARVAELSRNVDALKMLQQGAAAVNAVPASGAASAPPAASAPLPADPAQGGMIDSLAAQPWLLPGAGVLALLLAGIGAWRLRGRFGKAAGETSFLASREQADSFFGASGGQQVDTRDATRASTLGYSLSQIDAIGDVDPVAEADVYLAYGRDLQAEEILKEALRNTPDRMAVRIKLLELYAKRGDSKAFELLATELLAMSHGVGEDWARAQSLGQQFDPDNALYQAGGRPEPHEGQPSSGGVLGASAPRLALDQPVQAAENLALPELAAGGLDLDLDLGPSADDLVVQPAAGALPSVDLGLDFEFEDRPPQPSGDAIPRAPSLDIDALAMTLDDDEDEDTKPGELDDAGDTVLDFGRFPDLASGLPADEDSIAAGDLDGFAAGDPLLRKLELAEEFRQIGDLDGARDLLEELLVKASGSLRDRAQAMLDAMA
jgi:pilus assembly protein FimV